MAIAIGLLKTFLELARSRKTGVLDSIAQDARVRIFIEEGVIVFADEGTPGDALRQLLLREKVLTQEQHDAALEWMIEIKKQGKSARLGEVLVELGMLTKQQLHAALAAQVQQKVVRALGWPTATIRFLESYGPLDLHARFATAIEPLVPAALRLVDAARIEQLFVQSLERYPALRSDPVPGGGPTRAEILSRVEAFSFRPPEREFVLGFDGTRSIREILGTTAPIDPSVLTAALLLTECLDLHASALTASRRETPSGRRPANPTPFRGMAPPPRTAYSSKPPSGTSAAAATAAAESGDERRTTRPSRPSAVHAPPPDEKEQAKNVAARLRSAQDAKRALDEASSKSVAADKPTVPALDDPTPQEQARPDSRAIAEQAYQLARGYVRANRLPQALAELKRAVAMHATAEYELWVAWVELRIDAKYDKARIDTARRAAENAVAQDPAFGFGYFVLGHIAFREGDHARASELFERANTLEPAALDDVRDVRLRPAEGARSETHSDVRPLAPLLTTPRPMPAAPVATAPPAPAAAPAAPAAPASLRTTLASSGAPPPPPSAPSAPGSLRTTLVSGAPPPSAPLAPAPPAEIKTSDFAAPQHRGVTVPSVARAVDDQPDSDIERFTVDFGRAAAAAPAPAAPVPPAPAPAVPAPAVPATPGAASPTESVPPAAATPSKPVPPAAPSRPAPPRPEPSRAPRPPSASHPPRPDATRESSDATRDSSGTSSPADVAAHKSTIEVGAEAGASNGAPHKMGEAPPREAPPREEARASAKDAAKASPRADALHARAVAPPNAEAAAESEAERDEAAEAVPASRGAATGPKSGPPQRAERGLSFTARALLAAATVALACVFLWKRFGGTSGVTETEPAGGVNTLAGEADAAEAAATGGGVASSVRSDDAATPTVEGTDAAPSSANDAATVVAIELGPESDAGVAVGVAEDGGAVASAEVDAGRPLPPFTGALDLPPAADGHRVYVDGKMIGVPPTPIVIGCGQHIVRIGSAGKDRDVFVPCGGRLSLPYP